MNVVTALELRRCRSSADEVKDIRDKAAAVKLYMQQAGESMEAQNAAAEIKVRAERRAGEMLREMEKNKGTRTIGGNVSGGSPMSPPENTPRLNDIGVTKKQSSRFQQAAGVPEEQFERHIDEKKAAGKPITSSGVAKLATALKTVFQNAPGCEVSDLLDH